MLGNASVFKVEEEEEEDEEKGEGRIVVFNVMSIYGYGCHGNEWVTKDTTSCLRGMEHDSD